ncbi:hypothetical protein BKA81DRAFT_358678 [Phyllosticta paracitricarpa]
MSKRASASTAYFCHDCQRHSQSLTRSSHSEISHKILRPRASIYVPNSIWPCRLQGREFQQNVLHQSGVLFGDNAEKSLRSQVVLGPYNRMLLIQSNFLPSPDVPCKTFPPLSVCMAARFTTSKLHSSSQVPNCIGSYHVNRPSLTAVGQTMLFPTCIQ